MHKHRRGSPERELDGLDFLMGYPLDCPEICCTIRVDPKMAAYDLSA